MTFKDIILPKITQADRIHHMVDAHIKTMNKNTSTV